MHVVSDLRAILACVPIVLALPAIALSQPLPAEVLSGVGVPVCRPGGSRATQDERCSAPSSESETAIRSERELTITIDPVSRPTGRCAAAVEVEYAQWNDTVRLNGVIENETCAASGGDYTVDVLIRADSGEVSTLSFEESWSRDDGDDVGVESEYPVGENVEVLRVRTRRVSCRCVSAPEE